MKPKVLVKPVANGDVPKHVLDKRLTEARINETNKRAHISETREKGVRMQLAVARGDLINKDLVVKQASYLFVAMRAKMLAAPLVYSRKLLAAQDEHAMQEALRAMMHELLAELHDMPRKITDPNWMATLEDGEEP